MLAILSHVLAVTALTSSTSQCVDGKRHTLSYTASVGNGAGFVDLDGPELTGRLMVHLLGRGTSSAPRL